MKTDEQRAVAELLSTLRPIWKKRGRNVKFRHWTGRNTFVEGNMAVLTNEQFFTVTVEPKTAAGNPAPIDGDVTFESSDPAVVSVVVTGPNSAELHSGILGVSQITATFDADLDFGEVRTVTAVEAISVVAAEAETATLVFGPPQLKPVAANTAISGETGDVTT